MYRLGNSNISKLVVVLTYLVSSTTWAETDITESTEVNRTRPIYDYSQQQTTTNVTVKNISNQFFYSPLTLVIDSITTPEVTVADPDGVGMDGKPFFNYGNMIGDGIFSPNEVSTSRTIRFNNPKRLRFRFTTNVLSETEPSGQGVCWGDPHCVTFDRLGYDFQAAGEFVLVRSIDSNLEIQARMEPWRNSRVVSIISAIAMNVSGDRVGIYLNRNPAVYINGVPTLTSEAMTLPNNGRIEPSAGGYIIAWPDGSQLRVTFGGSNLNLRIVLSGSWRNRVEGLMGNFDGSTVDELVTSDGVVINNPPSFDELYKHYGESWRITQETSLFDYLNSNNTETFTDRNFPRSFVSSAVLSASVREQARMQCLNAGVTGPALLEACMLDIGLTGDINFAEFPAGTSEPDDTVIVDGELGRSEDNPAKSCYDILQHGIVVGDQKYWIKLPSGVFEMHCNFTADSGGWTRVGALDTTQGYCGNNSVTDMRINPDASMGKVPDNDVKGMLMTSENSPKDIMFYSRIDDRYVWHALESVEDFNTSSKHRSSSFYCTNWHCDNGTIDRSACGSEGQGCPVTAHGIGGFTKKIYIDSNFSRHIRGMHVNGNMCGLPNYERTSIWVYVR